jgi:hypothetical protein
MCLAEATRAKRSSELMLIETIPLDLLGQTCRQTGWQIHPVIE